VFATDDTDNTGDVLESAGYTSTTWAKDTRLTFVSEEYGSDQTVEIYCDNAELASALGLISEKMSSTGLDAQAELVSSKFGATATVSITGNRITVSDSNKFSMVVDADPGTAGTEFNDYDLDTPTAKTAITAAGTALTATISVLDAGPMDLQIGANEGQTMSIRIPRVDPVTLGIDKVNIATADGAQDAITLIDDAINTVSAIRSKLGAYQNRLEHSISNLDTSSENMTESLSRISDVDMAEEMAEYTQKNVLAQAGTSMLAQANQRPQTILSLLQS
jgi:flagellin